MWKSKEKQQFPLDYKNQAPIDRLLLLLALFLHFCCCHSIIRSLRFSSSSSSSFVGPFFHICLGLKGLSIGSEIVAECRDSTAFNLFHFISCTFSFPFFFIATPFAVASMCMQFICLQLDCMFPPLFSLFSPSFVLSVSTFVTVFYMSDCHIFSFLARFTSSNCNPSANCDFPQPQSASTLVINSRHHHHHYHHRRRSPCLIISLVCHKCQAVSEFPILHGKHLPLNTQKTCA